MDGWMDRYKDGWKSDGWMDRYMDGVEVRWLNG